MSVTSPSNKRTGKGKDRSLSVGGRSIGMISFVDILANGLIVMILLIFLTLKINREVQTAEEESMQDIGVLMSRKIAGALTSGSLPTQPPAFLHDYAASQVDIAPQEAVMPILEIHDDFVRLFYNGRTIDQDILYQKPNPLDHYLSSLNQTQKLNIRVDLYGIAPYYLVMSILKEHGIQIRHWHILGYDGAKPERLPYEETADAIVEKESEHNGDPQPGSSIGEQNQLSDEGPLAFSTPSDQLSAIGPQAETGPKSSSEFGNPDSLDGLQSPDLELSEEDAALLRKLLEGLAELLPPNSELMPQIPESIDDLKRLLEQMRENMPESAKPLFKVPDDDGQLSPFFNPFQRSEDSGINPLMFFGAVLHYLQVNQQAYDDGRMTDISAAEPALLMAIFSAHPGLLEALPYYPLVLNIYSRYLSQLKVTNETTGLEVDRLTDDNGNYPNEFVINPNTFSLQSQLHSNKEQKRLPMFEAFTPKKTNITLRRYPTLFGGEPIHISSETMIVMPPDQKNPGSFRWRLAAVVSQDLSDTSLGYVYSAFDADKNVIFPVQENLVTFDGVLIESRYPKKWLDVNLIFMVFYFLAGSVILYIFSRFNRV